MNTDGDLRTRLRSLTAEQQQFERNLARRLSVDAAGLAAMERLVTQGPATPTELARHLEISTAATTLVINRLADSGHVTREPHPSDRRKIVVRPSSQSARTARDHVALLIEHTAQLDASFSDEQRQTVNDFLDRALEIYAEANRELE